MSFYNTTITYYDDVIQVKFYDSICKSGGPAGQSKESDASIQYRSLSRARKKVFDYARVNVFDYFVALTFNPQKVDSFDYIESSRCMSTWLNNLRKDNPCMTYLGVPELHKSGRYHYHFLMGNVNLHLKDSGHRTPYGQVVYHVGNYNFGWTTAIEIYECGSKLAGYLSKYISKDLYNHTKGRKRYWCSRNLRLPEYKVINCNLQDLMSTYKFRGYELVYSKISDDACTILEYKIK